MADWGGVFSPSMLCGGFRNEGLSCRESLLDISRFSIVLEEGVGVVERLVSFSGDLLSSINSLPVRGVVPDLIGLFSGDLGEPNDEPPSSKLLKSLTFPV